MKTKNGFSLMALGLISLFVFTACASFSNNKLQQVENLPPLPEGASKQKATYTFSSGYDVFSKQEHSENVRQILEAEFVSVLQESGYFASLSPGDQGDITLDVRLDNTGDPVAMIPAFITGLSLYTIPSWATDNYIITAEVKGSDGQVHKYELEDSMTTVQWLPMILVAPFKNMISESKAVRLNAWRNLILRMEEDGILSQHKSAEKTSSINIRVRWAAPA